MDDYDDTYLSYLEAQKQDESLTWEEYAAIAMVRGLVGRGDTTRWDVGTIRGIILWSMVWCKWRP